MPEPVRCGPDELRTKFGISARLAARIGALVPQRIGFSEVVLESTGSGSPLEKLLLSPALSPASAKGLSEESLNQQFSSFGGEDSLVVSPWEDWTVVSFAEELEAEEGWKATGKELTLQAENQTLPAELSSFSGTAELFTPEDVARLKIQALAGSSVGERIGAIRQLALSPAPLNEKISIYLTLISDAEPGVRSQTAAALESLGLNSQISASMVDLVEGDSQQRLLAARMLSRLVDTGQELEAFVIVRSALRSLDKEPEVPVRAAIIDVFAKAAPLLGTRPEESQAVLRLLVQQIREFPDALWREADRALRALVTHLGEPALRQLWEHVKHESEHRARLELLCFLSQQDLPDDIHAPVVKEMAVRLGSLSSNDEQAIRLGSFLCDHGTPALQAMLEVYPSVHSLQRTHFIGLMDRTATDPDKQVDPEAKNQAAELFLKLLQGGDRNVRLAVLQGDLCGDPSLSVDIRRGLIQELFANLSDYHNPRTRDLVQVTVSRIGLAAISPLLEIIRSARRRDEQEIGLECLGKAFSFLEEGRETVARLAPEAVNLCRDIAREASVETAAIALLALGDICSCPLLPATLLHDLATELRADLPKSRRAFELLRALGRICGNPATPLEDRLKTVNLFLQLLRSDLPEVKAAATEEDLETIHLLGKEVLAYTDMLPTLMAGFSDICLAKDVPSSVRDRITEALCLKWRPVWDFVEIWGPSNNTLLLRTLREIADADHTSSESRHLILATFKDDFADPHVLAAFGHVCALHPNDDAVRSSSFEVLSNALAYWVDRDRIDRTDAPMLLKAFGEIIGADLDSKDADQLERMRDRVLGLLYDALRSKVQGVDQVLRSLAQSQALPEPIREDITDRLQHVFSLARKDSRLGVSL